MKIQRFFDKLYDFSGCFPSFLFLSFLGWYFIVSISTYNHMLYVNAYIDTVKQKGVGGVMLTMT